MPVYVDPLFNCRLFAKAGSVFEREGKSCHMMADTEEELHEMARRIGLKREWHQASPPHRRSHYDLTPARRKPAVACGTIEVPRGWKPGDPLPDSKQEGLFG